MWQQYLPATDQSNMNPETHTKPGRFHLCSTSGLSTLHKTIVWTAIFFISLLYINKDNFLVAIISACKDKLYVKIKVSEVFNSEPWNIIPHLSKETVPDFYDDQDLGMLLLLSLFCLVEFFSNEPNHPEIKQNCHIIVWIDILSPKTQTKWDPLAGCLIIPSFDSTDSLDKRPADTSSWNSLCYKQAESCTAWPPKQFPEFLQAFTYWL